MDEQSLAGLFDHTILKATATKKEVAAICCEALAMGAAAVCVNPANLEQVSDLLAGSSVKVCAVIGFPLGANTIEVKVFETMDAISRGAQEIDMVLNIGALIDGDLETVLMGISAVVQAAEGRVVKVILETCYLSEEQIRTACKLAKEAGADFVKTSTGFGSGGATATAVALMRKTVGQSMGVKASGGICTYESAMRLIASGASRLGLSASMAVLEEARR